MKYGFSFFILILLNVNSYAQVKLSVEAGSNLTFVTFKSEYNIAKNLYRRSPYIGGEFNLSRRFRLNERSFFKTDLGFTQRNNLNRQLVELTDNAGYVLLSTNRVRVSNNNIRLSFMYFISLKDKFYIGAGINTNYLLSSQSHIKAFKDKDFYLSNGTVAAAVYSNGYYKRPYLVPLVSIPIQIIIDMNRLYLYARFDKGVFNRIASVNTFYREIENTLSLGVGFKLIDKD